MVWAPDYTTANSLAEFLRIDDDLDDAALERAVTASSRAIDRHCRRQFGKVDVVEAREYTPRYSSTLGWVVPIDDLMTATGLVVTVDTAGDYSYATTLSVGDYRLRPRNAPANGRPWTELAITASGTRFCGRDGEVRVTATWGWSEVPVSVVEACMLQASRLHARRDAPFGIAGSPGSGSEMRLLAKVDPDVMVTLEDYRRKARPR